MIKKTKPVEEIPVQEETLFPEQQNVKDNPGFRVVVNSKDLKAFLAKLSKCKVVRSTLPILENFKFTVADGVMLGEATDLEFTLFEELEVENSSPGSGLIPRDVEKLIGKIKDQPITVIVENTCEKIGGIAGKEDRYVLNSKTSVITESGQFEYVGQHVDDYPMTKEPEPYFFGEESNFVKGEKVVTKQGCWIPVKEVHFTADGLKQIITNCLPFVSKDELILNGLSFVWDEKSFVAASDKHTLNVDFIEDAEHGSFIMPSNIAAVLKAFIKDESVNIRYGYQRIEVIFGKSKINFRNTEGALPGFLSVIPKDSNCSITLSKSNLKAILDRATLLQQTLTVLDIKESSVAVISEDTVYGRRMKEIILAEVTGETFPIGFDRTHLIKVLSTIPDEVIKLDLWGTDRAVTWKTENRTVLVMPLQFNAETFNFS